MHKPTIIARAQQPNRGAAIAVLTGLGLWDGMPPDERQAFCERGEVWDTPTGQTLVEAFAAAKQLVDGTPG